MQIRSQLGLCTLLLVLLAAALTSKAAQAQSAAQAHAAQTQATQQQAAQAQAEQEQAANQASAVNLSTAMGSLNRDQAAKLMPATVFYRGQTAPIQPRNSAGIRLPGDKLVLAAPVDTSGYSSAIKETYQAYLLTEVPLEVGGKTLPPGAYGIGFIASDQFVAMDLGANQLLSIPSTHDAALRRPNPMQITPDPASSGRFRLYSGRNYVTILPSISEH